MLAHAPEQQVATVAPMLHVKPSPAFVHAVVLVVGVQTWQPFAGFVSPELKYAPPMVHAAPHVPPTQTPASPQLVPSATLVNVVVLDAGTHSLHGLPPAGPAGYVVPSTLHCATVLSVPVSPGDVSDPVSGVLDWLSCPLSVSFVPVS
jgi:hypothetical protein